MMITAKIDKTPIQKRIELAVTNGLGYKTNTSFLKDRTDLTWTEKKIAEFLVQEEDVKNTKDGLQAHLFELMCKNRVYENRMPDYLKHLRTLKGFAIDEAKIKNLTSFRFNGIGLQEKIVGFLAMQSYR